MRLNNLITINDDFKYSVNIELDYDNVDKLNNYILTKENIDVLKFYINNLSKNRYRANFLIGPYGRGKSNLVLVLLNLITVYGEKENKIIEKFIKKIKKYDEELYIDICKFRKSESRLIPIIINSNYTDLEKSFLLSIKAALMKFKLKDVQLDSYYNTAYKTIERWENSNVVAFKLLNECIKKNNEYSLDELKVGLENLDIKYFKKFEEIYHCVTNGESFNPLVNNDVVKVYKDAITEIKKKYKNVVGFYVVFDEFSKFLEQSTNENIVNGITFLQNFAENAMNSDNNNQIHFTCITHKPMIEYINVFGEDKINEFKKIEGRFKNIYLTANNNETYELLKNTIIVKQKPELEKYKKQKYFEKIYDYCKKLKIFNGIDFDNILNCFPINPIVLYALTSSLVYIGQNERSIFTFATSNDNYSLKEYIKNESKISLYSLDILYDFFRWVIKNEKILHITKVFNRAESILLILEKNETNTSDEELIELCKKIIKSLAYIYICNDLEIFAPTIDNIKISLNIVPGENSKIENTCDLAVEYLENNNFINKIPLTENYRFISSTDALLKKKAYELSYKNDKFDVVASLNEIFAKNKYEFPRKYNEENYITRYFKHYIFDIDKLSLMTSFELYFDDNNNDMYEACDGLIIDVLLLNKKYKNKITEVLKKFDNDTKVVFRYKNVMLSDEIINLCRLLNSYNELLNEKNYNDENELNILINESAELKTLIINEMSKYFSESSVYFSTKISLKNKNSNVDGNKNSASYDNISFNRLLSEIADYNYKNTPKINYELINKFEIKKVMKKSVLTCINHILNNSLKDDTLPFENFTSATNSVYRAFKYSIEKIDSVNNDIVRKIFIDFLSTCEIKAQSIDTLINKLHKNKIFLRPSVMPLYFAYNFSNYYGNMVFYYIDREVVFTPELLFKILTDKKNYFISVIQNVNIKNKYLDKLLDIFDVVKNHNIAIDTKNLVKNIKTYFRTLPNIALTLNETNNILDIDKKHILFKNKILKDDLNNVEFIFDTTKEIYDTDDYDEIVKNIETMKSIFDDYLDLVTNKYVEIIKNDVLKISLETSIASAIKNIYITNEKNIKRRVYSIETKNFINYITNNKNYKDSDVLNELSKIWTKNYIADYKSNEFEKLKNGIIESILELNDTVENIQDTQVVCISIGSEMYEKNIKNEISPIAETCKNNIDEIFDEYGQSIDDTEKLSIIMKIAEELMR